MPFAPKHFVVAVDADVGADKELARGLVDAVADLASTFDAKVTLVHIALPVVSPDAPPMDTFGQAYRAMLDVLEARNAGAQRTLAELCEHVTARGRSCETQLVTRAGNIPDLILETAHNIGGDVIVIATHGRRGFKRVVLGSVAERTAHLADLPVLLLPPAH